MKKRPEDWERIRAKGKVFYVFYYWILLWAVPVAIISSIIGEFLGYGFKDIFTRAFYFRSLGISIIVILVGLFIGLFLWGINEWERKKNNRRN